MNERDGEEHYEPRRVDEETRGEARDGDEVLPLPEELAHEAGASRGLRPRALEAVLELAILVVLEVETRRVLHQPHAGRRAELFGEQRIEERDAAAEHIRDHRERKFQRQEERDVVEHAAREPLLEGRAGRRRPREAHHLVDDEGADVERRHRQQCAQQAQQRLRHGDARARLPDELQERGKITKSAEALAECLRGR